MSSSLIATQIGQRIFLPGHFDVPVVQEDARPLGSDDSAGYERRVRLPDGSLEEAVISAEEVEAVLGKGPDEVKAVTPVDAEKLRPSCTKRLAALQGRLPDAEQDEDDLDDAVRDPDRVGRLPREGRLHPGREGRPPHGSRWEARAAGLQDLAPAQGQLGVDRLLLYWTAEARKADALMVLPYDPKGVDEAGRHFDKTVRRIQAREFVVITPPEAAICKECDLRMLCRSEGTIMQGD